jgi:hypothetical protein
VNPVSSSPELEYAGENEVAIPVPPPSISPVRGQRSIRARRWVPYRGALRPAHRMRPSNPDAVRQGGDIESTVLFQCDNATVSRGSR